MKAFIHRLKGAQSDFLLFITALILLNLVSARSFCRIDLTMPKSYSLSQASKQLVRTLEQPLSVKVFFSSNLPSPYNSTAQYVRDLLSEYAGAANKEFSWENFDMNKPESQSIARSYRLSQVQIQEVKDNEVGFKNVWMGLALTYSDRIEIIDGITSSEGLEYKLTTKITRMINAVSALAGLKGQANLTLYLSPELEAFNIQGFSSIEQSVSDAFATVNGKNMSRMEYRKVYPTGDEIEKISTQYGLPAIRWTNKQDGSTGGALIALVLSYADSFRLIPLQMTQTLFGSYVITGLEDLEQNISDNLSSLVSRSTILGYTSGHGELNLQDAQTGAANFAAYASDMYTFKEIRTAEEDIPSNISTLVINGPSVQFTDEELYKIDQFVMKGGNLAVFLDPYNEKQEQTAMYYGMPPSYEKNNTALEKLLNTYGVEFGDGYVMDTQCYTSNKAGSGKTNFYYAPLIHQSGLDKKHPITANLSYVLFLQSGSFTFTSAENDAEVARHVLAKTSAKSWLENDISMLNPSYILPPEQDAMQAQNPAVLLEGSFQSAFKAPPKNGTEKEDEKTGFATDSHISKSVQKAKIFLSGTSKITSAALIDENGSQPVALFVRNALDYLNGNEDLCYMRTKGLSLSVLDNTSAASAALAKIVNQYVLPLLVVAAGFTGWQLKNRRRRKIRERYAEGAKDEIK